VPSKLVPLALSIGLAGAILASAACSGGGDAAEPAAGTGCRVERVVDGDTFWVDCLDERVRLLLVAAPEIAHEGEPADCFGDEAHDYLRERLPEGTAVRLQAGVEDTDGFGRPLRYAFLGDELLNETIVREGYAERYRDSPDTTYRAEIIAAEQDARANDRGLWAACR
jgi:micrococcal nuclease